MTPEQIETLKQELINTEERNESLCESAYMAYLENDHEAHDRLSADARSARILADTLRAALALAEERQAMEGWEATAACYTKDDCLVHQPRSSYWAVKSYPTWNYMTNESGELMKFDTAAQAIAAANAAMKAGE